MFIKLNQRGFTLVEIMIVVAIIGLLAAIAIPNLLRARTSANEGAVKYDLRTFSSAAEAFRSAQSVPQYPQTVAALTGANPAYLDATWVQGAAKHGFTVNYTAPAAPAQTFALSMRSATQNSYCVDNSGVILVAASNILDSAGGVCTGVGAAIS